MNFVYFKFLFVNTIKRRPVWITWVLFLFTCTSFIIILPLAAKMNTLQVWANTTMAICQTFMGMVASLFTAVLAINVFKDLNEEGTELIVISKPISRKKIVLTKFLLFGFFCLMANLSTILLSVFTIFLPRTEPQFYVGLLISMFIGNLVTFGIFGAISILLSAKFAKMGVIITNIIITLIFLVYQTLTLFVFSTPAKAMDDRYMSASTYIVHNRDSQTGEYKEDEIVKFIASPAPGNTKHPCSATNWKGMVDFWENTIKAINPTPILNVTDLAGQLALTYLSYKTNEYADRQANRMFGLSRFYDYQLTSPASPEIINGVVDKQSINWIYSDISPIFSLNLEINGEEEELSIDLPSTFGFDGVPPLNTTRLRGFTDLIPIGAIKSKEFSSSRDVLFEPDDWKKYSSKFDVMYQDIFDYRNYNDLMLSDVDPSDYPIVFAQDNNTIKRYYDLVWASLTGNANAYFSIDTELSNYNASSFEIINVDDLNDRFIQFKNYCFWKALEEQQTALNTITDIEDDAKTTAESLLQPLASYLGVYYEPNTWMMRCIFGEEDGLLEPNTNAPAINLMKTALSIIKANVPFDQYKQIAPTSTIAIVQKTAEIYDVVCNTYENYLFVSTTEPSRTNKYSGSTYMVVDTWLPYLNGFIRDYAKELNISIDLPIGQNLQYFFYKTNPTLNYWIFAVIWGVISLSLYAGGIVIYNKYDVK